MGWTGRLAAIGLTIAACGRLEFEELQRDAAGTGSFDVMLVDSDSSSTVTYVKPIAQRHPGAGSTDTFTIQADAPGHFIAMQVGCGDTTTVPTAISVTATGWQFTRPLAMATQNQLHVATYYGLSPDALPATVSVVWGTSTCSRGTSVLADEFATSAGGSAFDGAVQANGTGTCDGTIMMLHNGNAVWGACFSGTGVGGIGAGFLPGADNGGGDRAEYKLVAGPASTQELVTFPNSAEYLMSAIAIRSK